MEKYQKLSMKGNDPRGHTEGSSLASHYDSEAEVYNWRGPEVVFGLTYGFVNPGESVLDIGIGTGLGSVLFHKAGLRVYGAVCSGVLNFFKDLRLVFGEVAREAG